MYGSVPTSPRSVDEYRHIIGDRKIDELRELAAPLRGARVLHVNATAFGGGVAEILGTLVPLMNDLGLQADWQVIRGADEFYKVTKAMHNALQGMYIQWTAEMYDIWRRYNEMNAELFDQQYDFIVIHDPQPAGILHFLRRWRSPCQTGKWIWRCHIDLSEAQPDIWDFLRPYVEQYDAVIFTLEDFVKSDLRIPHVMIIPPAIDPLSPKNMDISPEMARELVQAHGIDVDRPFICQVARFDPWKDPLGVIDTYRLVRQQVPGLQLVMVAGMANDDPEGWSFFERTARRAGEDYDIHLLINVGNTGVNAIQRMARVIVQKSTREGFGLVVSEALWKGRPVVAGNAGGIPLQIVYGKNGYLVNTIPECADRVLFLLNRPDRADRMGRAGKEVVRENFLTTRYLRDSLRLFSTLKSA